MPSAWQAHKDILKSEERRRQDIFGILPSLCNQSSATIISTMSTVLKTRFGEFRGKNGNGVVQYLGIKYAALKDQLSIPEMIDSYGSDVVDATVFGFVTALVYFRAC